MLSRKKILNLFKEAFKEVKDLSNDLNVKFSENLILKGTKSKLDSVDIVTLLSIYERKFSKEYKKNINILDENFFNKYETITIKQIINFYLKGEKKKIKISLETDFNSKIILDRLKNFKKDKNFLIDFKSFNFENINLNFKNDLENNDFVFFSSQIEKTFNSFQESVLQGLNKKKLNKEISLFCENIIEVSKKK